MGLTQAPGNFQSQAVGTGQVALPTQLETVVEEQPETFVEDQPLEIIESGTEDYYDQEMPVYYEEFPQDMGSEATEGDGVLEETPTTPETPEEPEAKEEETSYTPYIIGGVLLLGAVGTYVYMNRNK